MGSLAWIDLQSLTGDIASARVRLAEARVEGDHRLARELEQEITEGEARRARLLAQISTHLADHGDEAANAALAAEEAPASDDEPPPGLADILEEAADETAPAPPPANDPEPIAASGARATGPAVPEDNAEGDSIVWDQLTPSDIERVKNELSERRSEVLARHAKELAELDADCSQLDELQQAIAAFLRKFNPSGESAVVQLGEEREWRLQANA